MSNDPASTSPNDPPVTWADVTRFVRQMSHDMRNHLNAAELQAVYLNELSPEGEMKEEIKRLREMLSHFGGALQQLSASLAQPRLNPIPYRISELIGDIRQKFENDFADRKANVKWEIPAGTETAEVDPQLIQAAIFELLDNAFRKRTGEKPIRVIAKATEGQLVIHLREPKSELPSSAKDWGREPLRHISQGHYGLGLNRVRAIVEAHGGCYKADTDPSASELVSTIMLPLTTPGN